MEFHGTDTSSTMESHGTWSAPISMKRAVPWSVPISMTRAVPWNSMEFHGNSSAPIWWQEQFYGIPRNSWCANFDDTSSSMEFHGTGGASFRCNEQFYVITWASMELGVSQFRWHEQFHGIPWNWESNFVDTSSSMELHGIPWNLECANFADTSSSMDYHGTSSAPISLT